MVQPAMASEQPSDLRPSQPSMPLSPHPVIERYYKQRKDRPEFVRSLFDRSARSYDRIDAVTSLGTGSRYRRRVLLRAGLGPGMRVLDVGCGTGLVALPAAEIVGAGGRVVGVDPSEAMREVARARKRFEAIAGVAEALPVGDGAFDMVTMGYALRHVESLGAAFAEFARVLRPGGTVVIMEISPPRTAPARLVTKLVMRWIVPAVSAVASLSADGWHLMRYFWETIDRCVPPERVLTELKAAGFDGVRRSVELGVFTVYTGRKPGAPAAPTTQGEQP